MVIAPSGEGSASAFVLKRYAHEVRVTTRKRPAQRVVIIVMVDGDNVGLQRRKEQLDAALREAAEEPRQRDEPVVILVPTWSVETWLLPQGPDIVETEDMKPRMRDPQLEHFETAATRVVTPLGDEPLTSIRDATHEIERVPR